MHLRQVRHKLVFEDRPWFIPALLFGAALALLMWAWVIYDARYDPGVIIYVLLGLAAVLFIAAMRLSDHSRIIFDARRRQLRWRAKTFWRARRVILNLDQVRGVHIEHAEDDKGEPGCRAVLETSQGPLPFSQHFAGGEENWRPIVAAVRGFLEISPAAAAPEREIAALFAAGGPYAAARGPHKN